MATDRMQNVAQFIQNEPNECRYNLSRICEPRIWPGFLFIARLTSLKPISISCAKLRPYPASHDLYDTRASSGSLNSKPINPSSNPNVNVTDQLQHKLKLKIPRGNRSISPSQYNNRIGMWLPIKFISSKPLVSNKFSKNFPNYPGINYHQLEHRCRILSSKIGSLNVCIKFHEQILINIDLSGVPYVCIRRKINLLNPRNFHP